MSRIHPSLPRSRGFALGLALVLGVSACSRNSEAADREAPTVVNVGRESVAIVAFDQISTGPTISGSIRADRESVVRAETGGSVVSVHAEKGQSVSSGALLARIEGNTAQDAYLAAQSAVRAAQHSLERAQRDAERQSSLAQAGAIAERDLEVARNGVVAAQAQLSNAQAQLSNAKRQVDNTQVRAPISGVVSERPVNAGDVVAPGAALFTVIDPRSMQLEANVPSDQLGSVRVGAPVEFTVTGYPGRTFTGTVERINPAADPVTRQVPVIVAIPNSQSTLVAGLFAQGRVSSEARQAMVIPSTAVDQRGVTPSVLRMKGGRTERVPVQLGITDPETERIEIASGLAAGDTILIGAALGISPNTPVRIGNQAAQR